MTRTFTRAEVKKHNNDHDTWLIIHNDVYDVTKFLNEHPGGPESLLDFAGQDGTQGFEDVGHSDDARIMMKKYKIGKVPPEEQSPVETCSKWKWALLALGFAVIMGVVAQKYMK